MKRSGAISADSIIKPRIFGPHEALAVADEFAAAMVDAVLIVNSAFPNGHVFPTIAMHPNLSRTPVIICAEHEPDLGDREWTTNAWCGVIMNNYVSKRTGRYVRPIAGDPDSREYRSELVTVLNACRAVRMMRREFIGRFGTRRAGFTPPPWTRWHS